jgi:DUF4097 and DUF4098 domain-containing protein YvlB
VRRLTLIPVVFLVVAGMASIHDTWRLGAVHAAGWSKGACGNDEGNTHNTSWWGHQERVCELRTATIALGGHHLAVKSENGGIEIAGEDRSDVVIEARVQAWGGSASEARDILNRVTIETSGDSIRDDGPHSHFGNSGYGVNYRLRVPRKLAVDLKSENGGIDIAHLDGKIDFDTTNGGVSLTDLAGEVHGSTVNGGLEIALTGTTWRGSGLKAETTNGGVTLQVPDHYSAHLETGTVNGGIHVDFPITVQGEIKKHLSTDLGGGGPTIHAETTNGGGEINRARGTS